MNDIVERLPAIPDDDSDFTPDLARKIIGLYQAEIVLLRGCVTMTALWERRALDAEAERDEARFELSESVSAIAYLNVSAERDRLRDEADTLRAAINYALTTDFGDGLVFLLNWNEGDPDAMKELDDHRHRHRIPGGER